MSKKLICLFLGLTMLLSVCLTGCAEKTEDEAYDDKVEAASQSAVTLSMYLMSEKPVDAETAAKIEAALNDITEKNTIHMKLHFYTAADYYAELEKATAALAEAKKNGTLQADAAKNEEKDTEKEESYQKVEIKYPPIADYQVDLFYFGGKAKFDQYLNGGVLAKIDDQLNSAVANQLYKYMPQHYLDYMDDVNGGKSYAVSNAKAIGNYTYLLLNKDALEATYHRSSGGTTTYEGYTSLTCEQVQEFLSDVSDASLGLTDTYYPIYTNMGRKELLFNNVQFLGVDKNGNMSDFFSVLGGYLQKAKVDDDVSYNNVYAELTNLMEDERFLSEMETLVKYEELGYFSDNKTTGKQFAVGYVSGGAELALEYADEYEMIPVGKPMLTEDELYEDMFAVCTNSSNVSKSMEILNLINTNEEARNLLLYGLEGEHYQLVDSELEDAFGEPYKMVERLNNEYVMSAARTGNTLITLPLKAEKQGETGDLPDMIEYMKQQNQDAVVNLSSGFQVDYEMATVLKSLKPLKKLYTNLSKAKGDANIAKAQAALDKAEKPIVDAYNKEMQAIRKLSETIWAKYLTCKTVEDFAAFKQWAETEMAKAEYQVKGVSLVDIHVGHIMEDGEIGHMNINAKTGKTKIEECDGKLKCETERLTLACVYNGWLMKAMDLDR